MKIQVGWGQSVVGFLRPVSWQVDVRKFAVAEEEEDEEEEEEINNACNHHSTTDMDSFRVIPGLFVFFILLFT